MAVWDTSVASGLHPDSPLFELASEAALSAEPVLLAAPTVQEIAFGLQRKAPADPKFQTALHWFTEILDAGVLGVLPLSWEAALLAGRLRARHPAPPPPPARSVRAAPSPSAGSPGWPTSRSRRAPGWPASPSTQRIKLTSSCSATPSPTFIPARAGWSSAPTRAGSRLICVFAVGVAAWAGEGAFEGALVRSWSAACAGVPPMIAA